MLKRKGFEYFEDSRSGRYEARVRNVKIITFFKVDLILRCVLKN